jgi:hypothetical protein
MLHGAEALDSLYHTMKTNDPVTQKLRLKKEMIQRIVLTLDTLKLLETKKPSEKFKTRLPNNAYFMNFRRYQSKQDLFWQEYRDKFHGDLKAYIAYLSGKYPFL